MKRTESRVMISVIIPMYNAGKSILNALESVKNQTYNAVFEIIVIDDGSTDDGKTKVELYKINHPEMIIVLLNQKNKGVSSARNRGLEIAKGEYIAFLDADDEWLPKKIKKQMLVFEKYPDIGFLASKRTRHKILFPYKVNTEELAEITFRKLLIRNEAHPSTVIFRDDVLRNTGLFNENQRYAEDVNYWLKISRNNKMYILNESLVIAGGGKRTFGISGLSADLKAMENGFQKNIFEVYKQNRINFIEFLFYSCFQKMKYIVLQLRSKCSVKNNYKK